MPGPPPSHAPSPRSAGTNPVRSLVAIIAAGLLVRLLALSFAMNSEADAVSRIWIAWRWLSHPEIVTHGVWGPLHTPLIALALWIWPDPVLSPVLLNILFSVATSGLVYVVAKELFGPRPAAWAGLAAAFYPVAIRNSLMSVSEVPFTFFVVLSLYWLALARRREASGYAIAAGLSLTLAAMLRYEAWALIVFFTPMLWRRPRLAALFLISAALFPVLWMIGNARYEGDPLYPLHAAAHWQIDVEGYNEGLTLTRIVKRLIYYPAALFLGMTPWIAGAAAYGMFAFLAATRNFAWGIPCSGLLLVFVVKACDGSLLLRGRYSLVVGTLLLPFCGRFASDVLKRVPSGRGRRRAEVFLILALAAAIPYSFLGARLAPRFLDSIFPMDIQVVPRLDAATRELVTLVQSQLRPASDGFVSDFTDWRSTYAVALSTRLHPDRVLVAPGQRDRTVDASALCRFFAVRPHGILVLRDASEFARAWHLGPGDLASVDGCAARLTLVPLSRVEARSVAIYRYAVDGSD